MNSASEDAPPAAFLESTPADQGLRLDVWLERRLGGLSRSRLQALIREGHITAGGQPLKPHRKVQAGFRVDIRVPPPTPSELKPEDIPLDVLHEDAAIIVINKPPGLVVHPAAGHATGTLVQALLHHCHDLAGIGGEQRPGIVHRLDRDTSGVMVVAKQAQAMNGLMAQFKAGTIRKVYTALVHGQPKPPAATVETLIGRSRHDRKKMSATPPHGRRAVTHFETAETLGGDFALLRVRIETGRTHQIRVHLAHIGHPVVGDPVYGRRKAIPGATRQMLHATELAFVHPRTGKAVTFRAPLPADFQALLATLR